MSSKEYFDQVAEKWDSMRQNFFSEAVREKAYQVAGVTSGKIAADLGAGTGFVTEGLIAKGLKVIAVDQSEAMLVEMKTRFSNYGLIDYRIGESEALPIDDSYVDYAFAYSTADDQLGRRGDFRLEDTIFHVTVSPMPALYEKCKSNIDEGLRVYIIVPDRCLAATRQNTEITLPGRIAVESIESFVSQNIEELSLFSQNKIIHGFSRLLETYNKRVDEAEIDKSFLIEIPTNLKSGK